MRSLLPLFAWIAACAGESLEMIAPDAEPVAPDGGAMDSAAIDSPKDATELVEGRLALRTSRPSSCSGCEDLDGDGLADEWESRVLAAFRPMVRFADGEPYLDDPDAKLLQIGRVFPVGTDPLVVRALIVVAYHRDYGSTCAGIGAHWGDPERVAVELEALPEGGAGDVILARAYTAGHENTAGDVSRSFAREELDRLEYTSEPRWAIHASLQKHASFANTTLCEEASKLPCIRETCGAAEELLPDVINAGEPEVPMLDDLTAYGFPGELAWTDTEFCGGSTRAPCAGPLINKLIDDPF
jgi:hypothetical protein